MAENLPRSTKRTIGRPGTQMYGGFIVHGERDPKLASSEARYRTYTEILLNTAIVAAGIRYFVNLLGNAAWKLKPAKADKDGVIATRIEKALMKDPRTPWHRVVRRAAMFRFYGFSLQEWTAERGDDGMITFADIEPRAQKTIWRWEVDKNGRVIGAYQQDPNTYEEIFLPRSKLVYVVDDTFNDSPEGLGVFRQLVDPVTRLKRYEQLEGFGFETDLRGLLVCRIPASLMQKMEKGGEMTAEERKELEDPLTDFAKNHIKTPRLALMLDSAVYKTEDNDERPSPQRLWDVELVRGGATSFPENAAAIDRLNRECAWILGIEHMLLGATTSGSFALSRDKTQNFFLICTGALRELGISFDNDLIAPLMRLNGWPKEKQPTLKSEGVSHSDATQLTEVIERISRAGVSLSTNDPFINYVRESLGLPDAVDPQPTVNVVATEEDTEGSTDSRTGTRSRTSPPTRTSAPTKAPGNV